MIRPEDADVKSETYLRICVKSWQEQHLQDYKKEIDRSILLGLNHEEFMTWGNGVRNLGARNALNQIAEEMRSIGWNVLVQEDHMYFNIKWSKTTFKWYQKLFWKEKLV